MLELTALWLETPDSGSVSFLSEYFERTFQFALKINRDNKKSEYDEIPRCGFTIKPIWRYVRYFYS